MLESLHELEITWICMVQALGAWLASPMLVITMIGSENFFMLVMPALYWCLDATTGSRVAVLLLTSSSLNMGLKIAFHGSRPYWLSSLIHAYSIESSFGFPSGHAQTAASIWGFLATRTRKRTGKILLLLLVFLIGFSRVFLGVHFISDVLGGWLMGALLLWGFLRLEGPITTWLQKRPLHQMLAFAFFSSLCLGAISYLPATDLTGWQAPQEWIQNAQAAAPGAHIDPLNINGAFTISGTWLGFFAGVALLYHRQGGFRVDGTPKQRILRYLVGLAGIFVFYFVLGQIFPRDASLASYLLRFLRYTLVGLWISWLSPLTFQKIGLAIKGQRQPNSEHSSS